MPLIGIDVGTSGCKCSLFDYDGRQINSAYREYDLIRLPGNRCEFDPGLVWECTKAAIKEITPGISQSDPCGIAVSSIGEAGVPLDASGEILYNSIMYADPRGVEEAQILADKLTPEGIMRVTGNPIHGMYSICKLMWMKKNLTDVFGKIDKFLLYQDFIGYKLTGNTVMDYSLASRTMAFDVVGKVWSETILNAAELTPDIFSKPVQSGSVVGTVLSSVSAELGLPSHTVVAAGAHDQVCAALGAGVVKEGMAVLGMGSSHCLTPVLEGPLLSDDMLKNNFNCEPHALADMYITLAFTNCGGSLLQWFRDNMSVSEINQGGKIYARLDKMVQESPTNLLVLPHLLGSGTPHIDVFSTGMIAGLTMDTTKIEIYKAFLEGVAYEMKYNLECLVDSGVNIQVIRAVGGGANSDIWVQIMADVLNRRMETLNVNEAGTIATAVLGGAAIGIYESAQDTVQSFIHVNKTFLPNRSKNQLYEERYAKYKKMYELAKQLRFD